MNWASTSPGRLDTGRHPRPPVWGCRGHMVRRMIAAAEQSLIQQATASVQSVSGRVGGLGGSSR